MQEKLTVTGPLFQPSALAGVLELEMLGEVLSILILPTVNDAVLPAMSVTEPMTDCTAPSPLSVVSALQNATPDRESAQLKLTVTFPLFQPLALGPGLREPLIVGRVRSMFIGPIVAEATFPALSAQAPVTD